MDSLFTPYLDSLAEKYEALMAMEPVHVAALPRGLPKAGVYVFSEEADHLYVGRTRRLRTRLIEHSDLRRTDAPFAFRLAREAVGKTVPSYRPSDSRKALLADPAFGQALAEAKARIRAMDIRYVEEQDPIPQTLLEIYVSVLTGSRYNHFSTT